MAGSGWNSKSEGREAPVSIPTPSADTEGNKAADVRDANPQWGHGKFGAGSWDPSTSKPEPRGDGWDSKSETPGSDSEDDD